MILYEYLSFAATRLGRLDERPQQCNGVVLHNIHLLDGFRTGLFSGIQTISRVRDRSEIHMKRTIIYYAATASLRPGLRSSFHHASLKRVNAKRDRDRLRRPLTDPEAAQIPKRTTSSTSTRNHLDKTSTSTSFATNPSPSPSLYFGLSYPVRGLALS